MIFNQIKTSQRVINCNKYSVPNKKAMYIELVVTRLQFITLGNVFFKLLGML